MQQVTKESRQQTLASQWAVHTIEVDDKEASIGCITMKLHQSMVGRALGGFLHWVSCENPQLGSCLLRTIPEEKEKEIQKSNWKDMVKNGSITDQSLYTNQVRGRQP